MVNQIRLLVASVTNAFKTTPLVSVLLSVIFLVLILILLMTIQANNLGFEDKTFWDWMELLLVPIMLGLGAWWLNWNDNKRDRELAKQKEQDAILEKYIDSMKNILLEHEDSLRKVTEPYTSNSIARTLTLTAARRLRPDLKRYVLNFLHETDLINANGPVIGLHKINLEDADLRAGFFPNIFLRSANLKRANLSFANLESANLKKSTLDYANLSFADLTNADLSGAWLEHTNLDGAKMDGIKLNSAVLINAILPDGSIYSGQGMDFKDLSKGKSEKGN